MGPIESLDAALSQHLHYVLSTAAAAHAGGGPAWDQVLAFYHVAPFTLEERKMTVECLHMTRGAVPAEVRVVLESVASWAFREIERFRQDPAFEASEAMRYLRHRASHLVDQETTNYERSIGIVPPPPPLPTAAPSPAAPSLGSIFANAQQTSKEVPWAGMKYKQVATLTCVNCGGPQEQPQDFMCKFCRRPIAGTIKPTV